MKLLNAAPRLQTAIRLSSSSRIVTSKPKQAYQSLPKCDQGLFHDLNPLSRQIVRKGWVSPVSGTVVDFVKAEPRDAEMINQFWVESFVDTNNICNHLGLSYQDLYGLHKPWTEEMIEKGDIIMGFDQTKFACLQLMKYHFQPEFEELFAGELPGHPNPQYHVKHDYAEDIASYDLPHNVARLACFLDDLVRQTGKFLPVEVKDVCIFEATCVHPLYQKDRMGSVIIATAVDATLRRNVVHGLGYCVATGTRKICEKQNWKFLFEARYDDYRENGEPVFFDMKDGATGSHQFYKKFI
uniref:N-acetyltransferase domain-containing protein n=1 Tax=Panagrellus redivivus TaxID=6233 RepID=A0A7E4VKV6_PANRE